MTPEEIDILTQAAALWTHEMIRGIMLDLLWFNPEQEKLIRQAHEIAKKYTALKS